MGISAMIGGQANALATGIAEEQFTSPSSFDIDRVIDRAALHGFLSPIQMLEDAGLGMVSGKLGEYIDNAIVKYVGNGNSQFIFEIDSLDFRTKQAQGFIASVKNPKPVTFIQQVMIISLKQGKDWALETFTRWVQR